MSYFEETDINTIREEFGLPVGIGKSIAREVLRLREEIQSLTHTGRQGELEQANVGLAGWNHQLTLALEFIREIVQESECRGDEDCDHCLVVYHIIPTALNENK